MEDARRTILDFISRNDCNSIFREFVGKSGATLGIFEGRNSGCHLTNSQYRCRFADRGYRIRTFSRTQYMGMRLVQWLSEFKLGRGNRSVGPARGRRQSRVRRTQRQWSVARPQVRRVSTREITSPLAKQRLACRHA